MSICEICGRIFSDRKICEYLWNPWENTCGWMVHFLLWQAAKPSGDKCTPWENTNQEPPTDFTDAHRYFLLGYPPTKTPTDCTDVHRLGDKTQPKDLWVSVKSVGEYSPTVVSVGSANSVGGYARLLGWCSWDSCTPWEGGVEGVSKLSYSKKITKPWLSQARALLCLKVVVTLDHRKN